MTVTRTIAALVVFVCMQVLALAAYMTATAGRDGLLTAAVLAVVGLAVGLPSLTVARGESRQHHG